MKSNSNFRLCCWLIGLIGVIVPRRLRADWRQEWEAELHWRAQQLAEWETLAWRAKLALFWHSIGALADALWLQSRRWEDEMMQDLRYGVRMLLKHKSFTVMAVLSLALGIGVNATMFGVVDTLLWRAPALVQDAEQVVRVYGKGYWTAPTRSYPDYLDLRDGTSSFAAVTAYQNGSYNFGNGVEVRQVKGQRVAQGYFQLLGLQPRLGRFFSTEETLLPGGGRGLVLGHGFWQRQFAGDANIVGREVRLNQETYTVIGVAPEGFTGVDLEPLEVWLALGENPAWRTNRGNFGAVNVIARLKPGVELAAAERDANLANLRGYTRAGVKQESEVMALGPLQRGRGPNKPQEVRVAQWLGAVSLIVLLIACANVANLLLTRALARRREIAVRLAHGASPLRIVRQLLTETLTLAVLAGSVALFLALWLAPVIRKLILPADIALSDIINWRVFIFTASASLLTGVLCSLVPAIQASRTEVTTSLKTGSGGSQCSSFLRTGLLVSQVALTFALLIGAGLFARSLWNVRDIKLGFEAERLLSVNVNLSSAGYQGAVAEAVYRRLLEHARTVPGTLAASEVNSVPFQSSWRTRFFIPGRDAEVAADQGGGRFNRLSNFVGVDFFKTTGIALLSGRAFTEADRAGAPLVAIVNEALARRIWPGESALGKCIKVLDANAPCTEIVGVSADSRVEKLFEPPAEQYYLPLSQPRREERSSALLLRTQGDATAMAETLRRALQTVEPNLPLINVQPLQAAIEPQILPWRLGATVFGLFGLLALLTASVGLYSVISYSVSQRTQELGIRLALGASVGNVMWLILRQGVTFAFSGVLLGGLISLGATRLVRSLLFGVSATDPLTFGGIAALLLFVTLLACYLPARRATQVDPLIALRHE